MGQAEKSKPNIKNKNNKPKTDSEKYETASTAPANESITPAKTETKESTLEKSAAFSTKLKELGIQQEEFEALLEYLRLNGNVDLESLLKNLTQGLSQQL